MDSSEDAKDLRSPEMLEEEEADPCPSKEKDGNAAELVTPCLRKKPPAPRVCNLSCVEQTPQIVAMRRCNGSKTHEQRTGELLETQKRKNASRKRHVCNICKKSFSHKSSLDIHSCARAPSRPFASIVCQKSSSVRAVPLSEQPNGEEADGRQAESSLQVEADRSETSSSRLRRRPLSRTVCGSSCKQDVTEEVHKRKIGGDKAQKHSREKLLGRKECADAIGKRLVCTVCEKPFSKKAYLDRHIRSIHVGERPFKCNVCEKSFSQKYQLDTHIRVHTGEKPFKCNVCEESFSQKGNLVRHILIHTGEKPFKCNVCKERFSQKCHLDSHIRVHRGEKPFKCTFCKESFSQKHNLHSHIRIHTGERPFKCDVCEKSFSHKCSLDKHIRIHTGEKPFKCNVCEERFSQKCHLDSHIHVHTGERPFKCSVCRKSFSQKGTLLRHTGIHIGERTFKCKLCKEFFSKKGSLRAHLHSHIRKSI